MISVWEKDQIVLASLTKFPRKVRGLSYKLFHLLVLYSRSVEWFLLLGGGKSSALAVLFQGGCRRFSSHPELAVLAVALAVSSVLL